MFKDIIIKYKISEYITLKIIKTTFLNIPIKSTCYLIDEKDNIKKII